MQQNRRKSTTFHLITSVCNSFIFFDFDKFHIFISTLYRIIFYLCSKHKTEYYENQMFTIISIRNKQLTLDCTRHKTPLPAKTGRRTSLAGSLQTRLDTRLRYTKEYRLTNPFQPIVGGMGIQPRRQAYGAFGHESSRNFTIYRHGTRGFISQNIYLYCASVGLGTVVRGSFNSDELAKILKLNEKQKVVLTQTVGYPAK